MGEERDKWWYIKRISEASSRYGDLLLDMMDIYHKHNLIGISFEEAKEYYEKHVKH